MWAPGIQTQVFALAQQALHQLNELKNPQGVSGDFVAWTEWIKLLAIGE